MDFLNKAIGQVSDLFRSMTPGARMIAGLLLAVVVISFGYLFQQRSAGPDEFLFGGAYLPDGQLNQIEAAIGKARLSGHRREGNRILVPGHQKSAYLAAIADGGAIPPNFHTYLENAINTGGPWESSAATKERLKIAKQQMLSEIIRAMEWVEEAVVIYDEQPASGLARTKQVTGSVNVKPMPGEMLDGRRASSLQNLVAHSVVGLRAEDVAVTSLGDAGGFGGAGGDISAETFKDPYYQTRVAYEQYKKQSIQNALRDIPGVRVEVNAELDDTIQETIHNLQPDKQGTALRSNSTEETSQQGSPDGGGQPGVIAQGPGRQGASEQLQRQNNSKTSKVVEDTENVVGAERRDLQRKGFTPKEVLATVTIPRTYVENIWKIQNADAKDPPKIDDLKIIQQDLITNVQNIVVPLLPRQNRGENQYKQVQVVIVDTIAAPDIVPPSMTSNGLAWIGQYWTTLAMLGVTGFSLLVLKSIVTSAPKSGGPGMAAGPMLSLHSDEVKQAGGSAAGTDAPERSRLRIKKGVSLKDDLVEMVNEDPEAAAAILRSWIGKSA